MPSGNANASPPAESKGKKLEESEKADKADNEGPESKLPLKVGQPSEDV